MTKSRRVEAQISREDVNAFCNHCVSLRSAFRHYQILFEEGGELRRELLNHVAPILFSDLNLIFVEYIILGICKITDPEETRGHKNFTIRFFLKNCESQVPGKELAKLKELDDSIDSFRNKIVMARNKRIGHLDRDSVHDNRSLGAAEMKSWNQFWLDLEAFLCILYEHYIDPHGAFHLNGVGQLSDADNLVKALKESTFFQILWDDKTLASKCADVALMSKYSKA